MGTVPIYPSRFRLVYEKRVDTPAVGAQDLKPQALRVDGLPARGGLASRGNPTVEVGVVAGGLGRAIVPSGASTGVHEAVELRDGGRAWNGKGVSEAVANVNGEIAHAVRGLDVMDQAGLDRLLV